MEFTLNMVFLTAGGKKVTFSVTDVKNATTDDDVKALMDAIVAKNIFTTSSGDLVSKVEAIFVEKKATKLIIA